MSFEILFPFEAGAKADRQEQKQIATEKAESGLSNRILQTEISDGNFRPPTHPNAPDHQATRIPFRE